MIKKSYYLVYVLLESQECISDCHTLYKRLEDAQEAMQKEIAECGENFKSGSVVTDLERCYEVRNEDGYGYIVGIDTLRPR